MAAPDPPSAFKALISDPSSNLCGNFKNTLLRLPVLVYRLVNWMFDSDGNLTEEFTRSVVPPGGLLFSAAILAPTGYLLCNGQTVSRTTYATLFSAISTTYGAGDGSTTFALPDYRDRFPIGVSATRVLGSAGGAETVVIAEANLPAHKHFLATTETKGDADDEVSATTQLARRKTDDGAGGDYRLVASSIAATLGLTSAAGAGTAHDNMPPYLACFIFIKT